MTPKVAIYVQHLLGAGHLVRAMSLAESLSSTGFEVLLFSGGFPVDIPVTGYQFYQLPPTRAIEGNFSRLVDDCGDPVNECWRSDRAARLLGAVQKFQPDLLITETFPFGRRQFRFELEPLINWVQSQSSVYLMSSIRDVLQRRSEAKNRLSAETIKQYYDGILVHADESLFDLGASFPLSHEIADKLIYTGYIHQFGGEQSLPMVEKRGECKAFQRPPRAPGEPSSFLTTRAEDGHDEIIVSGGSGTVSAGLIETARLARPLSSAKSRVWRLLTGRDQGGSTEYPEAGLIVEPNRTDFFTLLGRCALSVSQAGYNTTLDVLASNARSLMVPFKGDGETEQTDRAQALQRAGRVIKLDEADLTPPGLARAIDQALAMKPVEIKVNLDGAANSARLITNKLREWKRECLQR